MSEHSPAPWHVTENKIIRTAQSKRGHTCECCGFTRYEWEEAEEATIFSVGCYKGEIGRGINAVGTALAQHIDLKADAHLMAAAPGLLEACKYVREHLEPITRFHEDEWARNLDAAIEKAQGGGVV